MTNKVDNLWNMVRSRGGGGGGGTVAQTKSQYFNFLRNWNENYCAVIKNCMTGPGLPLWHHL